MTPSSGRRRSRHPRAAKGPNRLGQWQLWPLGQNLTDSGDSAHDAFNPLPSEQRADVDGGLVQYDQYHSINVLPVWNVLRAQGRLRGPRHADGLAD